MIISRDAALEGHTVNLLVCCLTITYSHDDRKKNLEATVDCFCLLLEQLLLNHQILMICYTSTMNNSNNNNRMGPMIWYIIPKVSYIRQNPAIIQSHYETKTPSMYWDEVMGVIRSNTWRTTHTDNFILCNTNSMRWTIGECTHHEHKLMCLWIMLSVQSVF